MRTGDWKSNERDEDGGAAGALTGLFIVVGGMLGGQGGAMFAFVLAMVMNLRELLVLRQDRAPHVSRAAGWA
jgi:hypothetical protein